MKFHLEHTFKNVDLAAYEAIYLDETFNRALMPIAELKSREELERREEGRRLFRKVKVVPQRNLPAVVKKLVNGDIVSVEESWFDRDKHRIEWQQHLSILPGKLRVAGSVEFVPVSGGVRRVLTGDVDVDVFGIGKIIEKTVVDNLKETYDKIALFTQKWIDEGRAS